MNKFNFWLAVITIATCSLAFFIENPMDTDPRGTPSLQSK